MSVAPESGRNRIMIYGPENDGTCIVEFKSRWRRIAPASDLLLFAKHLFVASTSAYAAVITLVQLTPPRSRAISTAVLTASSRLSV